MEINKDTSVEIEREVNGEIVTEVVNIMDPDFTEKVLDHESRKRDKEALSALMNASRVMSPNLSERMQTYMGQPFPATLFEACQWGLKNIKDTDGAFNSSYYLEHKCTEMIFRYINSKYKELGGNFSTTYCTKRTIDVLDKHFKCLVDTNPIYLNKEPDTIIEVVVFDKEKVEGIVTDKGELWIFVPTAYIHDKLKEDVKLSFRSVIDNSKVVASSAHHIGVAVKSLGSLLGSIETYDDSKKFKSCGELFDKDHRPSTKPIDLMLAGRTKRKPWER